MTLYKFSPIGSKIPLRYRCSDTLHSKMMHCNHCLYVTITMTHKKGSQEYHHLIIYPLTARVVGASDDFATSFLHFFLFSTALWDSANSKPVHSLMLSSHLFLCLPSSPFRCALQFRWFLPDLMNRRHDHTTAVCISLQ